MTQLDILGKDDLCAHSSLFQSESYYAVEHFLIEPCMDGHIRLN
jgi:hypothetical protein